LLANASLKKDSPTERQLIANRHLLFDEVERVTILPHDRNAQEAKFACPMRRLVRVKPDEVAGVGQLVVRQGSQQRADAPTCPRWI